MRSFRLAGPVEQFANWLEDFTEEFGVSPTRCNMSQVDFEVLIDDLKPLPTTSLPIEGPVTVFGVQIQVAP